MTSFSNEKEEWHLSQMRRKSGIFLSKSVNYSKLERRKSGVNEREGRVVLSKSKEE